MKILESYNVQIFCGLREGYGIKTHQIEDVERVLQKYVDEKKECVTLTPTQFIYTKGDEPGVIIGLITYPRFPRTKEEIRERAIEIAKILMVTFKQQRITITTPAESIMIEEEDVKNDL